MRMQIISFVRFLSARQIVHTSSKICILTMDQLIVLWHVTKYWILKVKCNKTTKTLTRYLYYLLGQKLTLPAVANNKSYRKGCWLTFLQFWLKFKGILPKVYAELRSSCSMKANSYGRKQFSTNKCNLQINSQ